MGTKQERQGILLESGTNEVEFLVIRLGSQRYGINVSKICQILVFDPSIVSQMPNQKPEVLGVASFREQTISMIDLSINLQRRGDPLLEQRLLIIAEFNNRRTGFIVDGVDRIERVSWTKFEPIDHATCNGAASSIVGTVRSSDGLIIILDLESILAALDPSMSVTHFADQIEDASMDRSSIKVLHCEDSVVIQKLVHQVLCDAGFTHIEQVNNGSEGLQYLNTVGRNAVDIVLSDIEMPAMDGLTFCKKLREDPKFGDVPVVFFSSMINEQMTAKCRSVGGNAAYSKPQINMIVKVIEELTRTERSKV